MSIPVQQRSPMHAVAVLLAAVLWGTTGTVAHFAPAGSNPLAIGLATFGIGGLVLAAVSARRVAAVLRQRAHLGWVLAGAVGVVLYPAGYYPAMALAGVAVGNVVALGSGPIFAALLEWLVDRRRPDARWAVATAVAATGIVLLVSGEPATDGTAAADPAGAALGVVLALAAGFGYALYAFAGARLIGRGAPSTGAMGALFLVGGAACLAWLALVGIGPLGSPAGLATIGYLGLVPMALAYLLFGYGLRVLRSSTATTIALLEPVVATLLAVAVVGERPSPIGWAGLAAIALGIALLTVRRPLTARGRRVALVDGAVAASAADDSAETAYDDADDTEQGHDRARPQDEAPQR
ncbi:EamA family transporter [Agrococcus sp. ProA11]|uniref:DMT family transporter n=1 Tax=Agrococcus chionoecetis TaxID=3153752 RepID=UPI0032606D4E